MRRTGEGKPNPPHYGFIQLVTVHVLGLNCIFEYKTSSTAIMRHIVSSLQVLETSWILVGYIS